MNTLGYLFIILAAFIVRGLTRGRLITDLPTDLGDAFTAVITGNYGLLNEVLARSQGIPSVVPNPNEEVVQAPDGPVKGDAYKIVAFARAQLGKPYLWGASGQTAYDCSGLTFAAYRSIGINLPRTTVGQIMSGSNVAKADLQAGDLVFPDPGHVQIYSGNGNVIESPKPGLSVREVPMWGFFSARRII
jgi:cell wall-associated NlpC family hydrolase